MSVYEHQISAAQTQRWRQCSVSMKKLFATWPSQIPQQGTGADSVDLDGVTRENEHTDERGHHHEHQHREAQKTLFERGPHEGPSVESRRTGSGAGPDRSRGRGETCR